MIDLHLHTTASDGTLEPSALVARAAAAGLRVIAVTDHDTLAGLPEAREAATSRGLRLIDGVEITAVDEGHDVHMLAYFVDPGDAALAGFLASQRADRERRVLEIAARLASLGAPIDIGPVILRRAGGSMGRPQIADALVAAGHARDREDAFDRFIGSDRPAFVPRQGPAPVDVIRIVGRAGGLVSMAHPALTRRDELIPRLASAGLAALEARHSDHDAAAERHYRELASRYGLAVTGGSDFHGDIRDTAALLGTFVLPEEDFTAFEARRG